MPKSILNEDKARMRFSKILLEDKSSQEDVADYVKKVIKNGSIDKELNDAFNKAIKSGEVSRELEKKVKNIVADCVNNLFKTLWFKHNFYEDEIRR